MEKFFFVGSKNDDSPAGLRVFEFDCANGAFSEVGAAEDAVNPIYLAVSADGTRLYSAQEVAPGGDGRTGGIAVYAVDEPRLEKIAEYPCAPTVPCHLSLSHDGKKLVYAEYSNAWTGVFEVTDDGLLAGPVAEVQHKGSGPDKSRQEAAHCHYAALTPDDAVICVCDLGLDRIFCYDPACPGGEMRELYGAGCRAKPAAGPRHLAFHPNGKFVFLLNELDSTVVSLRNDGRGAFVEIGTYQMLPSAFSGESKAAAVKVSPDGKWVLASNRGHDSIAAFLVDDVGGGLERKAVNMLAGKFPRDFEFSPDGRFVVVGHKLSNEIAVYAFDSATGAMAHTGHVNNGMVKPLCFVFSRRA